MHNTYNSRRQNYTLNPVRLDRILLTYYTFMKKCKNSGCRKSPEQNKQKNGRNKQRIRPKPVVTPPDSVTQIGILRTERFSRPDIPANLRVVRSRSAIADNDHHRRTEKKIIRNRHQEMNITKERDPRAYLVPKIGSAQCRTGHQPRKHTRQIDPAPKNT